MKQPLKVLIVEDSENDALLLLRELKKEGFDPAHKRVEDPASMAGALDEEQWDVILCDYSMPQFSAPDALELLRERGLDDPFIVISGTIGEDVAVETMKAGAHDYLMKGHLTRLGEAIRREMKEADNRRKRRRAEAKIEHLNRVLLAVRNVNQLIVREKDPQRLIEQACRFLIESRGYRGAWIVLLDESEKLVLAAQAGFGEAFAGVLEQLNRRKLPGCGRAALDQPNALAVTDSQTTCSDCPLWTDISDFGSLTVRISHDDKVYGLLSVNFPLGFIEDDDEKGLFEEVAGDIAFALYNYKIEEERKQAEEALRTSSLATETSMNGIFAADINGMITYANAAAVKMWGYKSAKKMVGTNAIEYWTISTQGKARDMMMVLLKEGHVSTSGELTGRRLDGTEFIVDSNSVLLKDDKEKPAGMIGSFSDITERRQMQASLAQSDRLASMGMLAAGVAHEINNPLAYILYNLESLTDDLPRLITSLHKCQDFIIQRLGSEEWAKLMGADLEYFNPLMLDDIQDRFKDAMEGSYRIKDIARGLGTFSRVEQDRLVPVHLTHVIEVAINMVFNEIKYRSRLVKDYGEVSTVLANDGRLSQVFLNLLVNAAHSIDEGDVEGNEIRIKTWQAGDQVYAEVHDSGKGIAKEHIGQLFEPFFSTKKIGVGTGLGLPISKNIIEGYGGAIEVKSEVGRGTSFIVRLPVRQAQEPAQAKPASEPPAEPLVSGRILVIDDEPGIRSSMKRILSEHEVVEAASGNVGQRIIEDDQAFDLILCDLMMPVVSGVEFHEWLVERYPRLAKQVVFITGGAFIPKIREYLAKVDNPQLEKPFESTDLKKLVSELIVAHRAKT
ncbi:MAG: response regulator [Deltaproteobacteria bacterium]|nr:response regulator [Deltaproteobacteria bacterium]